MQALLKIAQNIDHDYDRMGFLSHSKLNQYVTFPSSFENIYWSLAAI